MRLFIAYLCLGCSAVLAQIDGPDSVPEHTLVRMSVELGEGDSAVWEALKDGGGFITADGQALADGKNYIFTGPPGRYRVRSTILASGKLRQEVKFVVIEKQGSDPDEPDVPPDDPDNPDEPTPPSDPLARKVYDAALKVRSDNRAAEAAALADIFDAVAGQAAGVSGMTVKDMMELTSRRMKSDIPPATRMKWDGWKTEYAAIMENAGLTTLDQHIKAWNNFASALRSVR